MHLIYFIKAKYTIGHHINTKINWKNLAFPVIWWQWGKLQKKFVHYSILFHHQYFHKRRNQSKTQYIIYVDKWICFWILWYNVFHKYLGHNLICQTWWFWEFTFDANEEREKNHNTHYKSFVQFKRVSHVKTWGHFYW